MDGRSKGPLALAFLGDPNSIHTRRWITFFAERGHRINLLVPDNQPVEWGLDARISLVRFEAYPPRPIRGLSSMATRRSLGRAIRVAHPDVLHAHALSRYGWMAHLSGFRPYVISAWGTDVFAADRTSRWTRWRSRRALAAASMVTAVSRPLADAAIRLGAQVDRVRIVQFGIDSSRFVPGPPSDELREQIGVVGRRVIFAPRALRPLYRNQVLIEALGLLPADVVLVLSEAGQDPDERTHLEIAADRVGVSSRVRFVPGIPHAKMPQFYRLADVVASVPESDAFPVTALEAMATGIPVVLSDLASAREVFQTLDATAVVPVGDVAATAAAIRDRLDLTPGVRADLGTRLRQAAIALAEIGQNLGPMEDEYRRLAGRR